MRSTFSLLGTIKCSTCGTDVDIAELGDHVCAPQKEEEPILLQKKPPAASQDPSRPGKHALPPIDPDAANRPYLGRDEPTPRSSSSGSQEISPATPQDGQPLRQPFEQNGAPQLKESASSSVYTAGTPGDAGVSPQHLFAPPPNDALFAPVSPTANAGSKLMAKLTSIAPGPFALNASPPPPLASPYGERPSSSKGKDSDNNYSPYSGGFSSPDPDITSKNEMSGKERQREQAERKLSGATEIETGQDRNSSGGQRSPISGFDQSTRSRRPQSSASVLSTLSKSRPDALILMPYSDENNSQPKATPVDVEKPLPSPSYQAYRPPQPPQHIPRSPTFPDRPRTPAGYGPRLQGAQRLPVGLPSSPAHNRKKSNITSNNGNPGLLPQLQPGPGRQRGPERQTPNPGDRSMSRLGTRDGDDGKPRKIDIDPVGSPYRNLPLSASKSLSASLPPSSNSTNSKRTGSTISKTGRPQIPPPSKPLPHIPGHQKQISTSGSLNLKDIDSLMKDLQDSMKDLNSSPVTDESGLRSPAIIPSPLHINYPKTPNEQTPKSGKQGSLNKKAPVKSNCRGCGEAIKGKGLTSSDGRLTGRYHKECFVCQTCREPFATSTFYVWDDLPYCSRHYHALNNSLCKSCDLGIEGPCLETERRDRFHPHCFTCMDCRRVLGDDYFEINGRTYCERDAHRFMQQQRSRLGPGRNMPMGKMERRRTRMMMM